MNREIKFKAKRLDSGEWIEGDLVHSTNYIGIGQISGIFPDTRVVHRVDPNTVCQFTGRVDKYGKELYENDIIDFRTIMDVPLTGKIVWSDASSFFELLDSNGHKMRELWKALDIKRKGSALDKDDNHE